ncbi:MAG: phage major capsid protein [Nitrospiraceae bacterium]|nr:phage major capsid protein [Nitrospiraceae bacterium]
MSEMLKILGEIKDGTMETMGQVNQLKGQVNDLEGRVNDLAIAGRLSKIGKTPPIPYGRQQRSVSLLKVATANYLAREGVGNPWDRLNAGFEKEIVTEATRKAMDAGTAGSGGGYVIPQEYLGDEFIELLRAKSVVLRAGATFAPNLTGSPVRIPRQTGSGTVYWVGQNADITKSDASYGEVQMTPKTMAMRMQFSNLLNLLSNPAIEQLIRNDFALSAALELDRVALRGSGTANQPLGLANMAGIPSYAIGANGGSLSIDDLYGLMAVIEDANALGSTLALVTNPKGLRKLKRQRIQQYSGDTGGAYALAPAVLTDEALSKLVGLTCLTTTQLPVNLAKGSSTDCTEVYFGNWADLIIGQWGGVEILATNVGGNAWAQNAIEVRLVQNVDVQVRHKESFVICSDARTA